ncbi:MAG TPA: phosphoglycerate mutase family protein [Terriglobales bacterium]|nr:phosphoglycerate mutase family protein [Terriglobales bacterium]
MTIYFLRHASAGTAVSNPKKDERRPLDEEGILQARYIGRMLANLDVQVEQIISSPLKRALQTASLVANELAFEGEVQRDDALRPESEFAQFRAMAERYRKLDAIMVVGHNPSLTEFLAKAVGSGATTTHLELKKGAVAKVDLKGRSGLLEWLITPKIARTLQWSSKTSSRPKTERK